MTAQLAACWGDGAPVLLVHGGLVSDPVQHWAAVRPLAGHFSLRVAVRSGYADNPAPPLTTIDECAAEAIELLGEGAHLVGHSMGGLIALQAAAARPDRVKSLTVVEAPAFDAARGDESVERLIDRLRPAYAEETPDGFIRGFVRALTDEELPPEFAPTPAHRRGIEAHMAEPIPWNVQVPVKKLAGASFPKLVITGGWHPAFEVIGKRLAEQIGAEWLVLRGREHGVQSLGEPFNNVLSALWTQ